MKNHKKISEYELVNETLEDNCTLIVELNSTSKYIIRNIKGFLDCKGFLPQLFFQDWLKIDLDEDVGCSTTWVRRGVGKILSQFGVDIFDLANEFLQDCNSISRMFHLKFS